MGTRAVQHFQSHAHAMRKAGLGCSTIFAERHTTNLRNLRSLGDLRRTKTALKITIGDIPCHWFAREV